MRITKSAVDAAKPAASEYTLWDGELAGFGLRVMPSGRKSYIVKYRVGGGRAAQQRKVTLGAHGVLTPVQAREKAKDILASARFGDDAGRTLRPGGAPVETVADLIDLWKAEAAHIDRRNGKARKPSSVAGDIGRIEAHVIPLLGKRQLRDLGRADLEKFRDQVASGRTAAIRKTRPRGVARVRGGKGTAARTIRVLSSVFAFAVERGIMPHNPTAGVRLQPAERRERFLSGDELARLGKALARAERAGAHPASIAIIRLLALTGARRGEIVNLRWSEVDLERGFLFLTDSKTGKKAIPLSAPAIEVLAGVARIEGEEWVFPASRGGGPWTGVSGDWATIRTAANLEGVRLHDLRHTFASIGAAGGFGLPIIGAVLGHSQSSTTHRYAHLAADPVKMAADRIAGVIAARMGDKLQVVES